LGGARDLGQSGARATSRELARHGIRVAHELPGVGQNLQDHVDFTLLYKAQSPHLFGFTPRGFARLPREIRRWRRDGTGLLATNFDSGWI
jgi:choline dehydrogenase-like flavoprotein